MTQHTSSRGGEDLWLDSRLAAVAPAHSWQPPGALSRRLLTPSWERKKKSFSIQLMVHSILQLTLKQKDDIWGTPCRYRGWVRLACVCQYGGTFIFTKPDLPSRRSRPFQRLVSNLGWPGTPVSHRKGHVWISVIISWYICALGETSSAQSWEMAGYS